MPTFRKLEMDYSGLGDVLHSYSSLGKCTTHKVYYTNANLFLDDGGLGSQLSPQLMNLCMVRSILISVLSGSIVLQYNMLITKFSFSLNEIEQLECMTN